MILDTAQEPSSNTPLRTLYGTPIVLSLLFPACTALPWHAASACYFPLLFVLYFHRDCSLYCHCLPCHCTRDAQLAYPYLNTAWAAAVLTVPPKLPAL